MTFDNTTGTTSGSSTIFVGVASLGVSNIYQTTNGGSTCMLFRDDVRETLMIDIGAALPTFDNTLMPHKGVHSPQEGVLYVSFADGAGPYDGTAGKVCCIYLFSIFSALITGYAR